MRLAFLLLLTLLTPRAVFALTPNDTYYSRQWYLEKISAPAAWDTQLGDSSVIVAVLDSGIDLDHPDLVEHIWKNPGEIADNNIDDDRNGFVDDIQGWDFVDHDNIPSPEVNPDSFADAVSHGSMIAGLIGAVTDNGEGVAGVDWHATIMPVRMLDESGSGDGVGATQAVEYAVKNGASVINLSFTGDINDDGFRAALQRAHQAGVVVVAAMGNSSIDTDETKIYPACYFDDSEDWVIGVGSTDVDDNFSLFSNYGHDCTDLLAPGEDIFGVSFDDSSSGFNHEYLGGWSGTSMASPLVTGAVALIKSAHRSLTPEQIRLALKLSVDPISVDDPDLVGKIGVGRLNIARALEIAGQLAGEGEEAITGGAFIKAPSFDAVYYVTESGGRRVFINSNVFFTWATSFDVVQTVSDEELGAYPLEGIMLPKAGSVLVKIVSSPTVYELLDNPEDQFSPILAAIANEQTAIDRFGIDWAKMVIDLPPTVFSHFSK